MMGRGAEVIHTGDEVAGAALTRQHNVGENVASASRAEPAAAAAAEGGAERGAAPTNALPEGFGSSGNAKEAELSFMVFVTDDDYRSAWRPCPAFDEEKPKD
ncbi:MAG: hypothetical protein Hals2KO_19230 [Halioglobus sp.]